jgi:hypothetical protein
VYDFASITDEPICISKNKPSRKNAPPAESDDRVPYAALTKVCRQIRKEYLKIQRRNASIQINLQDLPAYLATYHGKRCETRQLLATFGL